MLSPLDFTIAWVCALSTEFVAASALLDEKYPDADTLSAIDTNTYVLGRIARHNVVIALGNTHGYGFTSSSDVVRNIMRSFPHVRLGVMVGIGGGAPTAKHDIRLGDVVVGMPRDSSPGVIQYDFGNLTSQIPYMRIGSLKEPPGLLLSAASALESRHEMYGNRIDSNLSALLESYPRMKKRFGRPPIDSDRLFASMQHEGLLRRPARTQHEDDPAIHYGVIASSNFILKDAALRDKLAEHENVLCFEMEASGVMNHFPCLVIRGICDYADAHKTKEWQGYAALTAALYTKDLLGQVVPARLANERRLEELLSDSTALVTNHVGLSQHGRASREIIQWLAQPDFSYRHYDSLSKRAEGSAEWFLDSTEYQTWLESEQNILYVSGLPGCGKTVLSAIVANDLLSRFKDNANVLTAYVYIEYHKEESQRAQHIFSSILRQITESRSELLRPIKALYDDHYPRGTRPSVGELINALHQVMTLYSKAFIIVDGFDEMQVSRHDRAALLSELYHLQENFSTKIFITSRPDSDIRDALEGSMHVDLVPNQSDLARLLEAEVEKLPLFRGGNTALLMEAKEVIQSAASGSILITQLLAHSLRDAVTTKQVRAIIGKIASGAALGEGAKSGHRNIFHEHFQRIKAQPLLHANLARWTLAWVAWAKEPLTVTQLQHLLAIEVGTSRLDHENIPEVKSLIAVCAGLIELDHENQSTSRVKLASPFALEYIRAESSELLPGLLEVCITYLTFIKFEHGACLDSDSLDERLVQHPAYRYIASHWWYHASQVKPADRIQQTMKFLINQGSVEAASQILMASDLSTAVPSPKGVDGLHLASYCGLLEEVYTLLSNSTFNTGKADSLGRTAIWYASSQGHSTVVEILLKHTHVDAATSLRETALSVAALHGNEEVVRLLIGGAKPNTAWRDNAGATPLHLAAEGGHQGIITRLLDAGVDIDAVDHKGSTALHHAIKAGQQGAQETLTNLGANIDIKDNAGQTPIELAWSSKQQDWSTYTVDESFKIRQGTQAVCEVLRCIVGDKAGTVVLRKTFNWSQSKGDKISKVRRYLLNEQRIFQKLSHPFIVTYLGYEEHINHFKAALYMEYCDGGDLDQRHVQQDSEDEHESAKVALAETEVWSIIFQVAAAIAYLHHGLTIRSGKLRFAFEKHWESVIHRDIKPANIVLRETSDGDRIVKLCDLGFVKAISPGGRTTRRIGTPDFSPPQVKGGEGWTMKGDIYSFGSKSPFTIEELYKHADPEADLCKLIKQCKSYQPDERPSSLGILGLAQSHVSARNELLLRDALSSYLGPKPAEYLFQSLCKMIRWLDEPAAFSDAMQARRKLRVGRLKLLCEDGADALLETHPDAIHVVILLDRADKLETLLLANQSTDRNNGNQRIDAKWPDSGWTPLHLAVQEGKMNIENMLLGAGARTDLADKHGRRPEYYRRESDKVAENSLKTQVT